MFRYTFIALCLAALSFSVTGCGNDDNDALVIGYKNPADMFRPSDDDTTRVAQLRRDFFNETGVYLLFTDTIQHEYIGDDINGDPQYFTETIDMTYNVGQTSANSASYSFTYLTKYSDQKMTADFAREYLLNHITGRLRPYSLFLGRVINGVNDRGAALRPTALTNQRCIAVASSYLTLRNRTDAEKKNFAQTVINAIIAQLAQNNIHEFDKFFSYSSRYYNVDYSTLGIEGTEKVLLNYGFVGTPGLSSCPSRENDLNVYASMAVRYTPEEFVKRYDTPIVINKFNEMCNVLSHLGYVF